MVALVTHTNYEAWHHISLVVAQFQTKTDIVVYIHIMYCAHAQPQFFMYFFNV